MAIVSFYIVTIEFAGVVNLSEPHRYRLPVNCDIRLVESLTPSQRQFTVHGHGRPANIPLEHPRKTWTEPLTAEENDHLINLLEQMRVAYALPEGVGMDGSWNTLTIMSGKHNMSFQWWAYVPEGWESVSAVFDYVLALAERTYLTSAK